jgi:hypothetical protein
VTSIEPARTLLRQLETAWALTEYHLDGLSTDECLWRPAPVGLHVHRSDDGRWRPDWPTHEGYTLGPSSIAWTTWHIDFWWSMVINHTFGSQQLAPDAIDWAGSAEAVRDRLRHHHRTWRAALESLHTDAWADTAQTRWPFRDRPLADVVAWANVELMKNAAEVGYARFLYAVRVQP